MPCERTKRAGIRSEDIATQQQRRARNRRGYASLPHDDEGEQDEEEEEDEERLAVARRSRTGPAVHYDDDVAGRPGRSTRSIVMAQIARQHHQDDTVSRHDFVQGHRGSAPKPPPPKSTAGKQRDHQSCQLRDRAAKLHAIQETQRGGSRYGCTSPSTYEHQDRVASDVECYLKEVEYRRVYLKRLARCLIAYGVPTHRTEAMLETAAGRLEVDVQTFALPGLMFMAFEDVITHRSDLQMVRTVQGIDLKKLDRTYTVYQMVNHDMMSVGDAAHVLDEIINAHDDVHKWLRIVGHGLASIFAGLFAFEAGWIDILPLFLAGVLFGYISVRKNKPLCEVVVCTATAFVARWLGTIRWMGGGRHFCFSAIAQSSICYLLPGYLILCAAMELQSRSIMAGAAHLIYSLVYIIFLTFGTSMGVKLYGRLDSGATTDLQCHESVPTAVRVLAVIPFTMMMALLNNASWPQVPAATAVAVAGWLTSFALQSTAAGWGAAFAMCTGALAASLLAHLYARLAHRGPGVVLMPGLFVIVPGGVLAGGALRAGMQTTRSRPVMSPVVEALGYAAGGEHASSHGAAAYHVSGVGSPSTHASQHPTQTGGHVDSTSNLIMAVVAITVGIWLGNACVEFCGKLRRRRRGGKAADLRF